MIYIHIPFCEQKCSYCNFHFSTNFSLKDDFVEALLHEIELQSQHWIFDKNQSIYFGGGTPSVLSAQDIGRILAAINKHYPIEPSTEITLEANPNNLDKAYLQELKNLGINRLSIGTQSFFEDDLQLMNRSHKAQQAQTSVKLAQDLGFDNISIDLIYGAPSAQKNTWAQNLQIAVDLQIQHISSYALTIEPKTLLENLVDKKKILPPNEGQQSQDFAYMQDFLKNHDFEHYEISNFAKKGFRSGHNTAYWQGKAYLGLGPSAHSYNGANTRSWNVANNPKYIQQIQQNILPAEYEELSPENQYNEMLMIGLRSVFGVDLERLKSDFPLSISQYFEKNIEKYLKSEQVILENHRYHIKPEYWFLADGIASDLFLV